MAHSTTFLKKHNISNGKQYRNHETKIKQIIINIKISCKILKHQSDGSRYHERKTKHFNRKQYKNHERKIEKIIINRKILSKI